MSEKIVTRFAPSPTGFMHVGNLRTGFFAWLFARKNNGVFILRIEDTDKKREVEGSVEHIKESLKWIGMDWDQGPDIGGPHTPYIQSERLDIYKSYANKLIDSGMAYADPYSADEIESWKKQAEDEKRPFLFRDHRPDNPPVWDGTLLVQFGCNCHSH
jgi:glutamyl-tRNA synthetase